MRQTDQTLGRVDARAMFFCFPVYIIETIGPINWMKTVQIGTWLEKTARNSPIIGFMPVYERAKTG